MRKVPYMRRPLAFFLIILAAFTIPAPAQREPGRDYGRSVVYSRGGIVATSQTLASSAGADILRQGGNAIDAAIAANAVLSVIEPMMNGIGGDLFAIVYEPHTHKLYGLNSSGWAPQGLTLEFLKSKGTTDHIPRDIDAVTVPGAVAGWAALHDKFGKLPLAQVLRPAIFYAQNGVPITEISALDWELSVPALKDKPGFARTFLPDGHAPSPGEVFRDPNLAHSLTLIAEHGRDGFYKGPLAKALVDFSKQQGGTLAESDLSEFQPEWVSPISTTYRGWTVYEIPPNSQGIAALSMLNLMEQFPLREYGHNSAKALDRKSVV